MSDEASEIRAGYVRHLAERLQDDGLLHQSPPWVRRGRCHICAHILSLPIAEQLSLAAEAGRSLDAPSATPSRV